MQLLPSHRSTAKYDRQVSRPGCLVIQAQKNGFIGVIDDIPHSIWGVKIPDWMSSSRASPMTLAISAAIRSFFYQSFSAARSSCISFCFTATLAMFSLLIHSSSFCSTVVFYSPLNNDSKTFDGFDVPCFTSSAAQMDGGPCSNLEAFMIQFGSVETYIMGEIFHIEQNIHT